jgi:hypothetical protein
MTRMQSWGVLLTAAAAGTLLCACALDAVTLPEVDEDDFEEFVEDAAGVLRALFPYLSESEIGAITTALSFEEIVALRDELEAARAAAAEFSLDLFQTAEESVAERAEALEPENDGFPESLEAVGLACLYDTEAAQAEVLLSGVFSGKAPVHLSEGAVSVSVGGQVLPGQLSCLSGGESVDIVFLIDITGSMSNVIASVRDSVVSFVDAIEASGVEGTISVVSFQDTVGVDVTFQEPAPSGDLERSPFFTPVAIDDAAGVESARAFIERLEANRGADAPENLSGAIDFARNNVIGLRAGQPNVIDDAGDPPGVRPFPRLSSDRQVFVALTDISFHADDRDATNSSLEAAFVPRDAGEILRSLHQTGTVVHVIDPSWQDGSLEPTGSDGDVDADWFAVNTGGLGEDRVLGYSLVDLELVVVAEDTGLLDVVLDAVVETSCRYSFSADLSAVKEVEVTLAVGGEVSSELVAVASF